MVRLRRILLALVAVLASGLAMSSVASAASTNNPRWSICKLSNPAKTGNYNDRLCSEVNAGKKGEFELTILLAGETETLEAEAKPAEPTQTLKPSVGGATIECSALKLKAGATMKGSNAPNAGTSEESIEYSGCKVEGQEKCEINKEKSGKAKLTTNPLKDLLVFETKAAAEKEEGPTATQFEPVTGKEFIKFELSGTCTVTGAVKVEGSVVAQNPEGEKTNETHEIVGPVTPITEYFVNNAGATEKKKAELKAFGVKSTYIGKSIIKLKPNPEVLHWGIHIK